MKKIYSFLFAATALFAAVSCQKEVAPEVEAPKGEKITFTASTEVETKTALHENGKSTIWVAGDQISVFDANKEGNNRCFNIDALSEDAKTSTFSYEGEFVKDQSGMADPTVVALYPYQADAYCDFFYYDRNYITGINFPAEQTAVAGSFDSKAAFALGLGTMNTMELGFQNLYSLLKFTVTTANVKEVTVTFGGENAYVAGDAKIQMTLNTEKIGGSEPVFESPVLSIVENGTNTVKLSCKNGFSTEATYYIAVVPTSYESISIAYDGVVVKEIEKANTLQANKIYNLGSYPEEFVPQEGYVYLIPNNYWKTDGARFATYFFSETWVDMTLVEGQVNVYQCAIPEGENGGMLFCRMNPNNTENRWNVDNEPNAPLWNQTIDLSLTDGCIYTMNEGSWDKGTWSGNPAVEKPVLPEVDATRYGLVGSFQGWDVANPVAMEYVSDGWIVAKNVELYKNDEFKFATGNSWDNPSFGTSEVKVLEENVEIDVVQGGQNMKVSKNGKYNLYLNPNAKKVKVECVEEYTDLKVNITIDNKANWSPLYITLKNGNEVVADNEVVTDNKYQISGDYIGTTLTCTLSNGSKTFEKNVTITKTGATVTLEETIIKLKIQLNTANAKQWWGNTMKIHVWNTGTSFDTSWPGNAMTSEGNYTWSIIVPSELVGKTINFLVHNGNGWQSSDSKVTISALGNTVTGSSIGVN